MAEPKSPPLRFGDAVRRLDEALPSWVNFSIGHSDAARLQVKEPEWSVVLYEVDAAFGKDRHLHASTGDDLAAVVREALDWFGAWTTAPDALARDAGRPPKLTAPGTADRADGVREQKDAS
jgi:hypothetical protein